MEYLTKLRRGVSSLRSRNQQIILFVAVLESLVVAAIEVVALQYLKKIQATTMDGPEKALSIYVSIFILSQVFQVVSVLDALLQKNSIQMFGLIFFNLATFVYSVIQLFQFRKAFDIANGTIPDASEYANTGKFVNNMLMVVCGVIGLCQLVYFWLVYKIYQEFGWSIYKRIGADRARRRMYRIYHIFIYLYKIDMFCYVGFAAQYVLLVLSSQPSERNLTIAALCTILLLLVLGVRAVRLEIRSVMLIFMTSLVMACVYFTYRTARIFTDPERVIKYANVDVFLSFFGGLSFAVSAATLVYAYKCYRNFGRGLKPYLVGGLDVGQTAAAPVREFKLDDDDDEGPLHGGNVEHQRWKSVV